MTTTTLTAGGASDSLAVAGGNDGALTLQTGPSGGKVNALAFASDGTPTFLKGPLASMVRLNTGNGYGSTSTKIRRFTTTVTNQGGDITYADSATLGGSFTINTSGVYSVTYSDTFTGIAQIGISLNTTQPTIAITSIAVADIVVCAYSGGVNTPQSVSATLYLSAASVLRAHTDGSGGGTPGPACQFIITRVA